MTPNVFLLGARGCGKTTYACWAKMQHLLTPEQANEVPPDDWRFGYTYTLEADNSVYPHLPPSSQAPHPPQESYNQLRFYDLGHPQEEDGPDYDAGNFLTRLKTIVLGGSAFLPFPPPTIGFIVCYSVQNEQSLAEVPCSPSTQTLPSTPFRPIVC